GDLTREVAKKTGSSETKARRKSELKVKLAETTSKLSGQVQGLLSGKALEALLALNRDNEGRKIVVEEHDDKMTSDKRKRSAKSKGQLIGGETKHDLFVSQVMNNSELMRTSWDISEVEV
ncbi:hypothetical protein THAOC_07106, partial [Thalassiosira oceanica]